jgi:hypothetical protein
MVRAWLVLIGCSVGLAAQSGAATTRADDLVLQIGVTLVGRSGGMALLDEAGTDRTDHESVTGFLYAPPDLCGCGASAREPKTGDPASPSSASQVSSPGWGWFVTGQVLTQSRPGRDRAGTLAASLVEREPRRDGGGPGEDTDAPA